MSLVSLNLRDIFREYIANPHFWKSSKNLQVISCMGNFHGLENVMTNANFLLEMVYKTQC